MSFSIYAAGDTVKIDLGFLSNKDRISINNDVVFEGNLTAGATLAFNVGERDFLVESKLVQKLVPSISYRLRVIEKEDVLFDELYDYSGRLVANEKQARVNGAVNLFTVIGAILGFTTMMYLSFTSTVVPGGLTGGGIGGVGGALLGRGSAFLFFGRPK